MIKTVFLFPNGNVAVCDEHGQQMPELQGHYTEVVGRFTEQDLAGAEILVPQVISPARPPTPFEFLNLPIRRKESHMPALTKADLEDIFSYHQPAGGDAERYNLIRAAALRFAEVILDNTPASPDQTAAIRKLREAVMTANASIALRGKY